MISKKENGAKSRPFPTPMKVIRNRGSVILWCNTRQRTFTRMKRLVCLWLEEIIKVDHLMTFGSCRWRLFDGCALGRRACAHRYSFTTLVSRLTAQCIFSVASRPTQREPTICSRSGWRYQNFRQSRGSHSSTTSPASTRRRRTSCLRKAFQCTSLTEFIPSLPKISFFSLDGNFRALR